MSRLGATSTFLSLLIAPALASAQSDAGLWRWVHPNAKAVVSIDLQRVKQSPAGAMLREKFHAASPLPIPMAKIPGMEFLNDVDRVLISSPGEATAAAAPDDVPTATPEIPGIAGDAPFLIAIHGHFDLAKVKQVLVQYGAKPQVFNSIAVYRPQGKNGKDMAFVPVDATTILVGDASSIFASLERNKFAPPTPAPGSLLAHAAEMDANYEAWVLISAPEALGSERITQMLSGSEWGADTRGLEAGISFRNGLALDVLVRFVSEAAAQKMVSELTRMAKITTKDKGEPVVQELGKKLKIAAEGAAAHISLRLTAQELAKNVEMLQARQQLRITADPTPNRAPVANVRPVITPAPVPAKPAVIRIEGLDEGTREVPYPEP